MTPNDQATFSPLDPADVATLRRVWMNPLVLDVGARVYLVHDDTKMGRIEAMQDETCDVKWRNGHVTREALSELRRPISASLAGGYCGGKP